MSTPFNKRRNVLLAKILAWAETNSPGFPSIEGYEEQEVAEGIRHCGRQLHISFVEVLPGPEVQELTSRGRDHLAWLRDNGILE